MAIDKYESRRIRAEIRRVLMQYWDPIGVQDEPNASTEYDAYLGGVYELLVRGAPDHEIRDHLCRIVVERMELEPQVDPVERTIYELRAIPLGPQ